MRGKKVLYLWNNTQKSIMELLKDQDIQSFIGCGTYAAQREKLRKLLKNNKITPATVEDYVKRNKNQPPPRLQDTYYGAQRTRRNLPKKTQHGIIINGEKFTARQALERYPKHSKFLQQRGTLKEPSLHAKLRT